MSAIRTGNGVHSWWLFREPLIFETDEERRDAARLVWRWQTHLRLNAAAFGSGFDRLPDLARVLRIPGTQNCKDPQNPKPVSIYSQTDHRYNPTDFAEFLDDNGVPDAEQQEHTSEAWKEQFADSALSINPNATVPDNLLNRYIGADKRFKKTWFRQRDDLKDQSQSGYDLAAEEWGYWPEGRRNPLSRVKIGEKWSVRPERILTEEETVRVMARLSDPNLLVLETTIATGARISELLG